MWAWGDSKPSRASPSESAWEEVVLFEEADLWDVTDPGLVDTGLDGKSSFFSFALLSRKIRFSFLKILELALEFDNISEAQRRNADGGVIVRDIV